ncbi:MULTISPECIES: hypothetical protein [unclassified Acinetobacter]|uniref:hypothetical protein n=1 Tax=unclassified Acinetobacter TaxID=196816 RepID=UPI0015D383A9|nr:MULTISPECIES: hypothetical protein [unclassified Acinetobacter]
MEIQKERESFERLPLAELAIKSEYVYYNEKTNSYWPNEDFCPSDAPETMNFAWSAWQAAKAQAVPEVAQRQGGYYIRDLRSQSGNCMKFWYQAGYGTKHKNFFWCATLEEAKEYKGGCDWFEIWHAPYIDSLVEYTVDFQLADRGVGLVDLKAQEQGQ